MRLMIYVFSFWDAKIRVFIHNLKKKMKKRKALSNISCIIMQQQH